MSSEDQFYVCLRDGCDKKFKTMSGRSKHHRNCKKSVVQKDRAYDMEGERVQCKICKRTFSEVANWHKHHRKIHVQGKKEKQKKVHACVICSKEFPKLSKLKRHEETHSKETKKCQKCDRIFKRTDHFERHMIECNNEQPSENQLYDDMFPSMVIDNEEKSNISENDESINPENENVAEYNVDFDVDVEIDESDEETAIVDVDVETDERDEENMIVGVDVEADERDEENMIVVDDDHDPDVDTLHRNTRVKKVKNLSSVINKILNVNVNKNDQAKIIRKSLEDSAPTVLDSLMLPKSESLNESRLLSGVLDYLKGLDLKKAESRNQFMEILQNVCEVDDGHLVNDDFLAWITKRTGKQRPEQLLKAWRNFKGKETRGRSKISDDVQQMIRDKWLEYSIVTVDRRNGRDQMKIREIEFIKLFNDVQFPPEIVIEKFTSKRGTKMVRSTRRIATKTTFQVLRKLQEEGYHVSYGTVVKYKPFFVTKPCEREKQSCLCKFCLNLRLRFDELNKMLNDKGKKTESITTYFTHSCKCEHSKNGYLKLECISGSCSSCSLTPLYALTDLDIENNKIVRFHQFVVEAYEYLSKKLEPKTGKRTIRKECNESLSDFKKAFDNKQSAYLLHRFEIKNDIFHWSHILNDRELGLIFHQDYSENISVSPKFEPQDAHFSAKQTSLHCSVVYGVDGFINYAYHISDNKGHDSAYTTLVTCDLIQKYDSMDFPLIRIKSDNCSSQYCCLHVFESYINLSKKINKKIILYYGVNGHGRGLVDAMSGFGVKSPLRRAIVTENFFFKSDKELVEFCEKIHSGDDTKYFKHLPTDDIAAAREKRGKGVQIVGCQKARMISIFPDGTWQLKRHICSCLSCRQGKFNECDEVTKSTPEVMDPDLDCLDEDDVDPEMFTFIAENTYVAVYAFKKNPLDPFILFKVTKKLVVEDDDEDINGHRIQKGSECIKGHYLEKVRTKKGNVFYKEMENEIYVYPYQVFCPAVAFNEKDSCMTCIEYQFLSDSVNRFVGEERKTRRR